MRNGITTLMAVTAIAVTIAALWMTNRAVTPKKASWADVVAEAASGGYRLISTEELWERYRDNRGLLLLVDTRQQWEYRSGHIQGAFNFPMEPTWLDRWRKQDALEKLLEADKNRMVVFY